MPDKSKNVRLASARVNLGASEMASFASMPANMTSPVSSVVSLTASSVANLPASSLAKLPASSLAELVASLAAKLPEKQEVNFTASSISVANWPASALAKLPASSLAELVASFAVKLTASQEVNFTASSIASLAAYQIASIAANLPIGISGSASNVASILVELTSQPSIDIRGDQPIKGSISPL
ncbi:MAG: hypothetical protein ACK4ZI_09605 [Microcystis sp.]|jgi:hypothetical protein|uniref:hypothetical protein n=1 Tax=Microcystis sp. TaxID=1127 RepID=UPI003919ABB0